VNFDYSIAILVPHKFIPVLNGGHKVAFDLCEYLGRNTNVHCISVINVDDAYKGNFGLKKLFPGSSKKYYDPKSGYLLYKYLKKHKIRSCIVNHPFQAPLAYIVCRLAKVNFIVYSHNLEYQRFRSLGKWWSFGIYLLERLVYKQADLAFFISPCELNNAIREFSLDSNRCCFLPHLISETSSPQHELSSTVFTIIYFADFNYEPNRGTLDNILKNIKPLLDGLPDFPYLIKICGAGLPDSFVDLHIRATDNIEYLGFVEDISLTLNHVNVLLNPVLKGGGTQTKTIQALAAGITVVSSKTGAQGIQHDVCGEKLIQIEDADWQGYADCILSLNQTKNTVSMTPPAFYDTYHWKNVTLRIKSSIQALDNL
jgi:glycosyltransferase involved in cell wall biosynthesis